MALSIVYAPRDATISPAADIVAVHGLGGDAVNTWTHPKSKAFWLKDFLPKQIPDSRVMTFGYNAAAAFGQSTAEVIDHAKSLLTSLVDKREEPQEVQRPLVFIAHSLGGIVVKQALLQARLEPRYQSIKDATLGLIFLGTPHRGSDKATYGKVLANVAQFMSHRPPPRLLKALQTNSDILLRLTSDFRFQLPDYQVYSFFELRPMKEYSSLIVEKHSALLETNHEEQIPVDADHSAMCKFETEGDDTFERVYKRVKRMKNRPRRGVNEQSVSNYKQESPWRATKPSTETLAPEVQSSDSDSDIDGDLMRKLEELAVVKWAKKDYERAAAILVKVVDHHVERRRPQEEIKKFEIQLACLWCLQSQWQKAEAIAVRISDFTRKSEGDIIVSHILHTLSLMYLEKKNLEVASNHCKRSIGGKRKLLGKLHVSYQESLALLAHIYDVGGDLAEAEGYRSLLSNEYSTEMQLEPLHYLSSNLPGVDVSSVTAATINGSKSSSLVQSSLSTENDPPNKQSSVPNGSTNIKTQDFKPIVKILENRGTPTHGVNAVVQDGLVEDTKGNVVGRVVDGNPKNLLGRHVNNNGDVIDKYGNVKDHVELYETLPEDPLEENLSCPAREPELTEAESSTTMSISSPDLPIKMLSTSLAAKLTKESSTEEGLPGNNLPISEKKLTPIKIYDAKNSSISSTPPDPPCLHNEPTLLEGPGRQLPQPKDDPVVRQMVQHIHNDIECHVEYFYSDRDCGPLSLLAQSEIREFDSSHLPGSILSLIQNYPRPNRLIQHCIANLILSRIGLDNALGDSFLPNCMTALESSSAAQTKPGFAQALSRWRVVSAYLRQGPARDQAYREERDRRITAVATKLCHAFKPWAYGTDNARFQNIVKIMQRASDLGIMLFSQPASFAWTWDVPRVYRRGRPPLAVMPGLLRTTDKDGCPIPRPICLLIPEVSYVVLYCKADMPA